MDLTIYDIIKGPRITEKVYQLNQKLKQLVLEIHPQANKALVAEALKKLFNVEAEQINIIVAKGKNRRVGRYKTTGKTRKKAIITLKEGYTVDLMGLSQSTAEPEQTAGQREE